MDCSSELNRFADDGTVSNNYTVDNAARRCVRVVYARQARGRRACFHNFEPPRVARTIIMEECDPDYAGNVIGRGSFSTTRIISNTDAALCSIYFTKQQ